MLTQIEQLQINPQYMRFMARENLSLHQVQALFQCSKSHWHKTVNFQMPMLYQGQSYTLPFKPFPVSDHMSFQPLHVVYEDLTSIVVFKPAFLLVHGDGQQQDTLQSRVNGYLYEQGWPYPSQAVHRIDKEASGLVLFCKFPFFQPYYDQQMASHTIKKQYRCVVEGYFPSQDKILRFPIARNRHNAKKMRIDSKGKASWTKVHLLESAKHRSLLEVTIKTGRKHQIRLHLAHEGYPIINDPLYGHVHDRQGLLLQSWMLSYIPFGSSKPTTLYSPTDSRISL